MTRWVQRLFVIILALSLSHNIEVLDHILSCRF